MLDFEPVELRPDALQKARLALDVEDAQAAEARVRHAAQEVAFACARAAAHRHHEALLARAAAQRVDSRFRRVTHCAFTSSANSGVWSRGKRLQRFLEVLALKRLSAQAFVRRPAL